MAIDVLKNLPPEVIQTLEGDFEGHLMDLILLAGQTVKNKELIRDKFPQLGDPDFVKNAEVRLKKLNHLDFLPKLVGRLTATVNTPKDVFLVEFRGQDCPILGVTNGFKVGRHKVPTEVARLDFASPEMWNELTTNDNEEAEGVIGAVLLAQAACLTELEPGNVKFMLGFLGKNKEK